MTPLLSLVQWLHRDILFLLGVLIPVIKHLFFDIQNTTVVILFIIKLYTLIFLKRKCDIIIKSTIILKYWALIYDRSKGVSGFIVVLFLFNCWKISFILICFSKSDNMNLLIQLLNLVWKENQSVHFNITEMILIRKWNNWNHLHPLSERSFWSCSDSLLQLSSFFFSQKKIAEISKITEKKIIPDIMIRTQMFRSSHHKASNFWVQVSYYNIIKSKHWTLEKNNTKVTAENICSKKNMEECVLKTRMPQFQPK